MGGSSTDGMATEKAMPVDIDAVIDEMRRAREVCPHDLPRSEAAHHAVKHRNVSVDLLVKVLSAVGYNEVHPDTVLDNLKYGRKRKRACRFCELP